MAREIKILKCPQCGSKDKTDLKPDVFQCNHCKAIYYLENEDVNINYNDNRLKTDVPINKTRVQVVLAIVFAGLLLSSVILYLHLTKSDRGLTAVPTPATVKEKKDEYFSNHLSTHYLAQGLTQKPIIINIESRTYNDEKIGPTKATNYLIFYDPLDKKVLKEVKLQPNKTFTERSELRTFSNNRTYLITSPEIYEIDAEALELRLVGKQLFSGIAKAQDGPTSVKFSEDGDGFQLVTKEEETIYYFPIINKIYSPAAYEKAAHGFATLLPGAKEITYHQFTESKNEYSNYKLQLLKIKYIDNGPGPKTFQSFFIWTRSYVIGEGYRICLVIPDLKDFRRITSYKDLTPGRNYYKPMVVYEDDTTLLISFRVNASDTAPYKLQRLDRSTGAVIWTTPLAHGDDVKKLYRYKNGYYGFTNQSIDLFDLDGTSMDSFKN
jgi:hypothetical protein